MNSSRSISHSLQQDAPKLPTGFGFAGEPINVAVVIGTMFVLLAALSLTGAIPTMVSAVLIMVSALMIRWNCGQGIGRTASVFGAASVLSTALIHQVSLLDAVSICAVLLASAEWIGALRRSFEDEKRAADFDGLTGALRPHAIRCILDYELNRIKQSGGRMALFFMDLDNFKEVND